MDNKEKVLEALKKVDFSSLVDNTPVFSKETYELFKKGGLSEDEIATLEYAELKTRTLEVLPDDQKGMERVFGALAAISKDSAEENAKNLTLIAQKDPEMLLKLIALTEIYKSPVDQIEEKK